jgi:phosphoglycerate kinase
MAFTFYKAKGFEIGKSILDEASLELAKKLMEEAKDKGVKLMFPVDVKAAKAFDNDAESAFFDDDKIPPDWMGLDIGPKTIELYSDEIKNAKTVIWNGPMGAFEMPNFAAGTLGVAQTLAQTDAVSIIGGGDSAAAVEQFGLADKMTHISTGGGASLEFLEGLVLPGIAALLDKE